MHNTSQINPHFLYNTLESIRMRAIKAGNREVATAIKMLGKSMRYIIVKQAKERGFQGKFIILSGYSDFSYAQEAIRYDVSCYLTKPIDEDDLEKAVIETKNSIEEEQMPRRN